MGHPVDEEDRIEKTLVRNDTTNTGLKFDTPASLVIWLPKSRRGEQFTLDHDITIGRSQACDIMVDDQSMSKRHAMIMVNQYGVTIKDLGSTNRTFIDRMSLEPQRIFSLESNCSIRMGTTVFMFYKKGSVEASNLSQVFKQAYIDSLTDILNKRGLNERGPEMLEKASQHQVPFSVIIFDIDHFKKINDHHPEKHFAGDYVLKELSSMVQNTIIRVDDMFGRFGGEEFVISLYGANLQQAIEVGERLRKQVEASRFSFKGGPIPFTVSVGVSTYHPGDTWESLLQRADKAVYKSKEGGRNRVTASS